MRKLLPALLFLLFPVAVQGQSIQGRVLNHQVEGREPQGIGRVDVHLLCAQPNVMQAVGRSKQEILQMGTSVDQLVGALGQVLQGEFNFGEVHQRVYYTLKLGERIAERQWEQFTEAKLRSVETVDGGTFAFADLPPGPYLVAARVESVDLDDAFLYQHVVIGQKAEEVELTLAMDSYSPGDSFHLRELRKLVELLEEQAEENGDLTWEQLENAHSVVEAAALQAPLPQGLSAGYNCLVR